MPVNGYGRAERIPWTRAEPMDSWALRVPEIFPVRGSMPPRGQIDRELFGSSVVTGTTPRPTEGAGTLTICGSIRVANGHGWADRVWSRNPGPMAHAGNLPAATPPELATRPLVGRTQREISGSSVDL